MKLMFWEDLCERTVQKSPKGLGNQRLEDQIEGFRTVYAEGNRGPAWSHTGAGSMWSSKELLLKET